MLNMHVFLNLDIFWQKTRNTTKFKIKFSKFRITNSCQTSWLWSLSYQLSNELIYQRANLESFPKYTSQYKSNLIIYQWFYCQIKIWKCRIWLKIYFKKVKKILRKELFIYLYLFIMPLHTITRPIYMAAVDLVIINWNWG